MSKDLILAGSRHQAEWFRIHRFPDAEIVSSCPDLVGRRDGTLHLCGAWYENSDAVVIQQEARARGMKVIEEGNMIQGGQVQ